MFSKLMISSVLAVMAATGIAVTPGTAEAQPPMQRRYDNDFGRGRNDRDHDRRDRYEVLVRHRDHWDSHGKYRDRDDAERAARQLRRQGFKVKIDDC